MGSKNEFPRPSVRDWLLLFVGLCFMVAGILIIPENLSVGVSTLVFFGGCTIVFAGTIHRKLHFRQENKIIKADIIGGVPIRPSKTVILSLGLALFMSGSILFYFGAPYPLVYKLLSLLISSVGLCLLLGLLFGLLPVGYIQFDPTGISIGQRRWTIMIPWEQISSVSPGESEGNVILVLNSAPPVMSLESFESFEDNNLNKIQIIFHNWDGVFWEVYSKIAGIIDKIAKVHRSDENLEMYHVEYELDYPEPIRGRDELERA